MFNRRHNSYQITLKRFHSDQSFFRTAKKLNVFKTLFTNNFKTKLLILNLFYWVHWRQNSYQMTLEWFHSVQSFMRTACKLYMSNALFTFIFITKHRIVKLFKGWNWRHNTYQSKIERLDLVQTSSNIECKLSMSKTLFTNNFKTKPRIICLFIWVQWWTK